MVDDLFWLGGIKDIAATDQHIDARCYQTGSSFTLHTAIHFD